MQMKQAYIRILKIGFILVGIFLSNYIYTQYFYENDIQKYASIVELVRAVPKETKVLYLGESSNITYGHNDKDKRAISDFVSDYFPDLPIADITKPAAHAGIYLDLLKQIPEGDSIETLLLTLNMRTFNAQCLYSYTETSFQQSLVLLRDNPPLFNRFLLSFKAYDVKTDKERDEQVFAKWRREHFNKKWGIPYKTTIEWFKAMEKKGVMDSTGKMDDFETNLACTYIKTYSFEIDTNHNPRVKEFDALLAYAKERGWKIILNLLPENTDRANQLIGKKLVNMMEYNGNLLKTYYQNKGIPVVDNLLLLQNEAYLDQDWTTEHYHEQGRKSIAKNLALKLKKSYPNKFVQVDYSIPKRTYFNNCENRTSWEQLYTITDEKAFSLPNASKVNKETPFSITCETSLVGIADSLKTKLHINLMAYLPKLDESIKLVVEFSDGVPYTSEGYPLMHQINVSKEWKVYDLELDIPMHLRNANRLKIFVTNPLESGCYIDDFSIKIK